jgi:hypothetical protein
MVCSVPNPSSVSNNANIDTVDTYLTHSCLKLRMMNLYRSLHRRETAWIWREEIGVGARVRRGGGVVKIVDRGGSRSVYLLRSSHIRS